MTVPPETDEPGQGLLPDDWDTVRLGDIAAIERDGVAPGRIESGALFVGLENIATGGDFVGVAPVALGEIASTKFRFTDDHLLYGKLRPYLAKIALPDFAGVCSTDILPIRPGPRLDRRYLAHFLRQPGMVDFAASRATGANLPRLSPTVLGNFLVPLPPLSEQRRIAAILDAADALRAKRRSTIAALDTLTESIFLDMFGDSSRLSAVVVSGVADVQGGLTVNGKRSALALQVPYLRVANVGRGNIDVSEMKEIGLTEAELSRLTLKPEDLLIVEGHGNADEVGRVARWAGQVSPCVHQNHLIRLRFDAKKVVPRYAECYLNGRGGRAQVARIAKTTSGLNTISIGQVRAMRLPLPTLAEQQAFSDRASRTAEQLRVAHRSLSRLDGLFASLQSRAFRGEL